MNWEIGLYPKWIFEWVWLLLIIIGLSACSNLQQTEPKVIMLSLGQEKKQSEFEGNHENIYSTEHKANPVLNLKHLPAKVPSFTPNGWEVYDQTREFTAENLYELINGRAELYLAYDMVKMVYINFVNKGNSRQFVELFIYDMGTSTNAFGIFSVERSKRAPSLNLGRDSYKVDGHYFIWKGQYYIRIIASDSTKELNQIGMSMARKVSSHLADSGDPVWGLTALPQIDLISNSIKYFQVDAMGLDFMRNTYTAKYLKGNIEITSFLSKQDSSESSQDTVARYIEHTQKYGEGIEHIKQNGIKFVLCDMGDSFDVIFQKGELVGGVFSVKDRNIAAQAAFDFWKELRHE